MVVCLFGYVYFSDCELVTCDFVIRLCWCLFYFVVFWLACYTSVSGVCSGLCGCVTIGGLVFSMVMWWLFDVLLSSLLACFVVGWLSR